MVDSDSQIASAEMARRSQDRAQRSHHQASSSPGATVPKSHPAPSSSSTTAARSRKNLEQQMKREQRAALKASFGSNASQLKLTVYLILAVALVLIGLAFFTNNWLEVERRFYGSKFRKLGLWRMCFNSFSAPDDFQFKKFYVGCRWIFADEYRPIRRFLLPGSLTFLKLHFWFHHPEKQPKTASSWCLGSCKFSLQHPY